MVNLYNDAVGWECPDRRLREIIPGNRIGKILLQSNDPLLRVQPGNIGTQGDYFAVADHQNSRLAVRV